MKEIKLNSLEEIGSVARTFLEEIGSNKLIAFYGHMGAGKTTFIKALCDELGVEDVVNSPTFAIVNEYTDREGESVFHFDFYRIKSLDEAFGIGFDNYMDSGCFCFMEWPEKVEEILPEETLRVEICEVEDGTRLIKIC